METGVSKREVLTSLVSLTVILGVLYLVFRHFGITQVQESIERAGLWAPALMVLAKAATIVLAPLSGSPLYPLAGALFGFWKGSALLILGDILGGVVAFYISRLLGRHIVEKLIGSEERFLARALRMMSTTKGFLIARVCFIPLPEVAAYGAGLTRISFFTFILIYASVGVVPAMALAAAGAVLTLGVWWALPLALIAGASLIPIGFFLFRSVLNEWEQTR